MSLPAIINITAQQGEDLDLLFRYTENDNPIDLTALQDVIVSIIEIPTTGITLTKSLAAGELIVSGTDNNELVINLEETELSDAELLVQEVDFVFSDDLTRRYTQGFIRLPSTDKMDKNSAFEWDIKIQTEPGETSTETLTGLVAAGVAIKNETQDLKTAAETALAQFQDQFLGVFAEDPDTDLNGKPLGGGELYVNSSSGRLKHFGGSAWVDIISVVTGLRDETSTLKDQAATSANNAATSEGKSATWAEGTDAEVSDLGGTKSSQGWNTEAENTVTNFNSQKGAADGLASLDGNAQAEQPLNLTSSVLTPSNHFFRNEKRLLAYDYLNRPDEDPLSVSTSGHTWNHRTNDTFRVLNDRILLSGDASFAISTLYDIPADTGDIFGVYMNMSYITDNNTGICIWLDNSNYLMITVKQKYEVEVREVINGTSTTLLNASKLENPQRYRRQIVPVWTIFSRSTSGSVESMLIQYPFMIEPFEVKHNLTFFGNPFSIGLIGDESVFSAGGTVELFEIYDLNLLTIS